LYEDGTDTSSVSLVIKEGTASAKELPEETRKTIGRPEETRQAQAFELIEQMLENVNTRSNSKSYLASKLKFGNDTRDNVSMVSIS
jgi:hypothetical protein